MYIYIYIYTYIYIYIYIYVFPRRMLMWVYRVGATFMMLWMTAVVIIIEYNDVISHLTILIVST